MRLRTPPRLRKLTLKINRAIKPQAPIRININIQRLKISRGINKPNIPRLDEIIRYDDVFLIRGDFDVVWADGGLDGIWIVETFDIVEVGDVEGCNVVGGCEG